MNFTLLFIFLVLPSIIFLFTLSLICFRAREILLSIIFAWLPIGMISLAIILYLKLVSLKDIIKLSGPN